MAKRCRCFLCVAAVLLASLVGARATCDTTSPSLSNITLVPSTVDVTARDGKVTCSMTGIKDGPVPIDFVRCEIAPAGTGSHIVECRATRPKTGDAWNGTYACDMVIPRYSPPGVWSAYVVDVFDRNGNRAAYFAADLPNVRVNVLDATPDFTPPSIVGFDFNPKAVDVTSADARVRCSFQLADPLSGAIGASCSFSGTPGSASCTAAADPTHTAASCQLTIPRGKVAGTWTVTEITALDAADNSITVSTPDIAAHGWPTQLAVADAAPLTTPPELQNLTILPPAVDPLGAPSRVLVDMLVAATSPVTGSCTFVNTSTLISVGATDSGTGHAACGVPVPLDAPGGNWTLLWLYLFDHTLNQTILSQTALAYMGFPTTFTVGCSAPPEPAVYFSDRQTLRWHLSTASTRFNVYRGSCADLVDINADGLPDAGYGACQNGRDPNLQDTTFVDSDRPVPGACFDYVVTFSNGSAEQGLGYTSAALPRPLPQPCP